MKREFLKNFKVGDQELPKEVIDAILDENSRDIDATKLKFSDYETLREQLKTASETIARFEKMDIESIQKEAVAWKEKAEKAQAEAETKIAETKFEAALEKALSDAKGKNAKSICALLDMEALKSSSNPAEALKTALEAVKETDGYLFETSETPPPYAAGTGTAKTEQISKEAFAKMGYRERLELKKTAPEIYETLKE